MMKRAGWILALGLAGCGESTPPAPIPDGPVLTGLPTALPGEKPRASVSGAAWTAGGRTMKAVLEGQKASDPQTTLFRSTLPFPQTTWTAGAFEVTQLVYPAGSGVAARYQVMNHGEDTASCTLVVEGLAAAARFPLEIPSGSAKFVTVPGPNLASAPEGALEAAIQAWEKSLGGRTVQIPDPDLMTRYHLAIAGLAHAGEEAAIEARFFKVEGDAVRLVPDLPDAWRKESLDARALPTPHGPLSLKYSGAYDNVSIELEGTCKPPGGFRVATAPKSRSKIDGKDAEARDGILHVPAGARTIEVFKPLE